MTPEAIFAAILFAGPLPGRSLYSQIEVTTPTTVALMPTAAGPSAYQVVTEETAPLQCLQPLNVACRRSRVVREGLWHRPETFQEGLNRYAQISQAVALETDGDDELALLVLSVIRNESSLRKDVHSGIGKYAKGDRRESWCLGQIRIGVRRDTKVPWVDGLVAGDLVGLDATSTGNCIYVTAEYLRKCRARCNKPWHGDACEFVQYGGGSVGSSHPYIKARVATLRALRDAPTDLPWWARSAIAGGGVQ